MLWGVGLTECFLLPVDRLAKLTAAVLLAKDVPVYFFSTYVPTPFVVSHLLCLLLNHAGKGVLESSLKMHTSDFYQIPLFKQKIEAAWYKITQWLRLEVV